MDIIAQPSALTAATAASLPAAGQNSPPTGDGFARSLEQASARQQPPATSPDTPTSPTTPASLLPAAASETALLSAAASTSASKAVDEPQAPDSEGLPLGLDGLPPPTFTAALVDEDLASIRKRLELIDSAGRLPDTADAGLAATAGLMPTSAALPPPDNSTPGGATAALTPAIHAPQPPSHDTAPSATVAPPQVAPGGTTLAPPTTAEAGIAAIPPDADRPPVPTQATQSPPAIAGAQLTPNETSGTNGIASLAGSEGAAPLAHSEGSPSALAGLLPANQPAAGVTGSSSTGSATLHAPLASPEWRQGLSQQLVGLHQRGEQQIELHLNPAELGPLSISLKLGELGAQAHFLSAHPQVRHAIEQAIPQLREALAEQGINLGEASVGEQRQQQAQGDRSGQSGRSSSLSVIADDSDDSHLAAVAGPAAQALSGGIDLYA